MVPFCEALLCSDGAQALMLTGSFLASSDANAPFAQWSTERVCTWLEDFGLAQYVIFAARRPAEQRGQGAGSPTCRSPGERRRRPQPLGSEGTGAASPTRQKPGDRGSDPNSWEARGEKERSQLVRSEAATSKSRQKTHRSGSLGRRLHPAARLRSAKAPEEEGAALRAEVAGKPVS